MACHFVNALTGEKLFTHRIIRNDRRLYVGYLFHLVKDKLGYDSVELKLGSKVWKNEDELGLGGKVFLLDRVKHTLADKGEVTVEVIKLCGDMS